MRIADALELLSWPLVLARAAGAELGSRVDPIARLVSRRLGRGRRAPVPDGDDRAAVAPGDLRARAEAARYWLGPSRPVVHPAVAGALVDPEPGDLPVTYGVDRVVLIPRDPWSLFAFWDITSATRGTALEALAGEADAARPVLRIHDVPSADAKGTAGLSVDVEVTRGTASCYVSVGRPGVSYCAEIGLRTPDGRFRPLSRSGVATTPPATPAADTEVRWLTFGPTGPAWSPDQRPARPAADARTAPSSDERIAPAH
jgi:hypothetical protein